MAINLLIVDDNKVDHEIIKRFLAKSSMEINVRDAYTPDEAQQILDWEDIDCVLLDYHLGATDGVSFLQSIHKTLEEKAISTIILTGQGDETVAVEVMRYGAHNYLNKNDLTPELLIDAILRAVRHAASQQRSRISKVISQRQQRMESLAQLTGGMAHDMNNLLTVIQLNGEMLQDAIENQDDKHCLDALLAAAKQGTGITSRLLKFSRRQALTPVAINIQDVIQDSVVLVSSLMTSRISIQLDIAPDVWHVKLDRVEMENALMSMALNARDAMPDGGVLRIRAYNDPNFTASMFDPRAQDDVADFVVIEVEDTGCGMPEDVQERIFEPFFTTKDLGKGTGLGLSIVYGFVTQSRGYMNVSSSPGQGTKFSLYFPRSKQAQVSEATEEKLHVGTAGTLKRIMIVEDLEILRVTVGRTLRQHGYEVHDFETGDDALEALQEDTSKYDIVFSDIRMPGKASGIDLAKWVKTQAPQLPILLSSGYFDDDDSQEGDQPPDGVEVLPKPYDFRTLEKKLRSVAGGG